MSKNSATLIKTKLTAPKTVLKSVVRSRLLKILDTGACRKLTLLSAPAGYGKTSLVAEWMEQTPIQTVWISIDKDDNNPVRFIEYFIAALQQVQPNFGKSALDTLYSPQRPPMEQIVTVLINDIAEFTHDVVMVLDDYHMLHSTEIHDTLIFMINHLPSQFHLFITSRTDPPFPLPGLRARNQLTEIRMEDLKFNKREIEQFFHDAMQMRLSLENISTLHKQTEGWIAGLQMARLSLKQNNNIENFIQKIPRRNHHIFEYLEEEIFSHQPEYIQDFLIKTACLKRLNASLCDYILDRDDSQEILTYLDNANLFIFLLDNDREWYRYHQLFADVLVFRLKKSSPGLINELHLKASRWYQNQGLIEDAIYHTLEAEEYDLSAGLIEKLLEENINSEIVKSYNELNVIPDNIIQARPALLIYKSVLSQYLFQFEVVSEMLTQAEELIYKLLSTCPSNKNQDFNKLNDLLGRTFALRAWQRYIDGELEDAVALAQKANNHLKEDSYPFKITAMVTLAYIHLLNGDLDESQTYFKYVTELSRNKGFIFYESLGAHGLFSVKMISGELKAGELILNQVMERYKQRHPDQNRQLSACSTLLLSLGSVYRNQNKLDLAAEYLTKGIEFAKNHSNPLMVVFGYIELALVIRSQGDDKAAYEMLINAEALFPEHAVLILKVPAFIAYINIIRNNLEPVREWIEKKDITIHDDITVFNEFEYATYALYLMADNQYYQATELLNRLSECAKKGKRLGSLRHILILSALCHYKEKNTPKALETINQALLMAEPDDHFQIFIDHGEPMLELLILYKEAYIEIQSVELIEFADNIINRIKSNTLSSLPKNCPVLSPCHPEKQLPWSYRLDPLSRRELEVLRLIAINATNPEIADQLCISLNTVKTHLKRIYSKLYVNSRKKAVLHSKAIGLIE